MAERVTCPGCGLGLEVAEQSTAPWIDCPRCQTPVINATWHRGSAGELTWQGLAGTFLVVAGAVGGLVGAAMASDEREVARQQMRASSQALGLINLLAFAFVLLAGMLLLHASGRRPGGKLHTLAAVAALLAAVMLLVTSGLIGFIIGYAGR